MIIEDSDNLEQEVIYIITDSYGTVLSANRTLENARKFKAILIQAGNTGIDITEELLHN